MELDPLFLATMADLSSRIDGPVAEYETLMAAPLLRKLLMDDEPLVHAVNRERHLRLTFRINARPPMFEVLGGPLPDFWSIQDGFDPETAVPQMVQPKDVKLDALLAHTVMVVGSHAVTVRDLIAQASHIEGAVHAGRTQTEKEAAIQAVASELQVGGYPPDVRALRAVGRVVVRGLQPLVSAIESDA